LAKKNRKAAVSGTKRTEDLANHEVVVLAAFLLGAQYRHVDTEDIAMKANEIAPGRFTWRKYRSQVNIETVRKRLWDAMVPRTGAYLVGSEKSGWLLTEEGIKFAHPHCENLDSVDLSKIRQSSKERVWATRERERMAGEPAFEKFTKGDMDSITNAEAERFFRLDDYVQGKARITRIERVINHLGEDPTVGTAVHAIAGKLKVRGQ
jgi:hypothetical protein